MYIADSKLPIPAYKKIKNHLKSKGQSATWLAFSVDVSKYHMSRVLNGHNPLCDKLRVKINTVLETDY